MICLHGAGSPAERALARLRPFADQHRLLLLAPKSARATWDVASGASGRDAANIDALLREVDARYPIRRYALNGFSDGASYALSLGVANGHLFDSVIAWSPGFQAAATAAGRPRFFVSHGTEDSILPIGSTSRRLVPDLRTRGYDVTYAEFDGEHVVPSDIRERSVGWLTRDQ